MGILNKIMGNYSEELERLALQIDDGELTFDDIEDFLMKNNVSEQEYDRARLNAHKKRADMGHAVSQYYYALLIENTDKEEALDYYTKSADQGYIEAMEKLSLNYSQFANEQGIGFGEDPQKEFEWKKKAAETGDLNAICNLAREYSLGDIVEENEDEAERLYTIAAENEYAKGYLELANMVKYVNDREKRIELLNKAMACRYIDEDTFASTATGLGYCYKPSENNELADVRLSAYCFSLAYILGNDFCGGLARETGYQTQDGEWDKWLDDARNLRFQP